VHQRFATNTFPSWRLAHPYRMVAHNGEINTLRGNVNWMAARQASVDSKLFGNDISKLWPISYEGQSDTACFDNALEFLVQRRLLARPRDDDADPRGLGRQPADG
jgi:glutamate synthase (NADPH) large chain